MGAEPPQAVKEPIASGSAVAATSRRIRGQSSVRNAPAGGWRVREARADLPGWAVALPLRWAGSAVGTT
jgi:hypothetical protein